MPTYEYACKQCGEHLEVVQSFTDNSLTECPNCHGQLRKIFGSVGVTFKGSGFYKTDSRKSSSSGSDSNSSSKSASSTAETKSTETKPTESKSSDSSSSSSASSATDKAAK